MKIKNVTMSESLVKDKLMTTMMVMLQIFFALLLSVVINIITGLPMVSFVLGIVLWTMILFTTPVFDWCFINVKPNFAVILGNQAKYDKLDNDPHKRVVMFNLASIREVGPGIRGKLPWEVKFESVDLRSEIIIGNDERNPLKVYTLNNIELDIVYQVILTPFRGFLVNLVRKNEDAIKAYFRGIFEQEIINWVKKSSEEEIFGALADLNKVFKNILGGPNKASDIEMDWGIFTNSPQIISVNRSASYQKAAEGVKIGMKMQEIIRLINEDMQGKNVDPNVVLAVASAIVGNEIPGLILIPGLAGANADAVSKMILAQQNKQSPKKGK